MIICAAPRCGAPRAERGIFGECDWAVSNCCLEHTLDVDAEALGLAQPKCYACDAVSVGTCDRRRFVEGAVVAACARHADGGSIDDPSRDVEHVELLICAACGNREIHTLDWTDFNKRTYVGGLWSDGDPSDTGPAYASWCCDCQDQVEVRFEAFPAHKVEEYLPQNDELLLLLRSACWALGILGTPDGAPFPRPVDWLEPRGAGFGIDTPRLVERLKAAIRDRQEVLRSPELGGAPLERLKADGRDREVRS